MLSGENENRSATAERGVTGAAEGEHENTRSRLAPSQDYAFCSIREMYRKKT